MNLRGRLTRLERTLAFVENRCRTCGGRHAKDLISYLDPTATGASVCTCRCCPDWASLERLAREDLGEDIE
jgi:hypothetical protein